MKPSFPLRRYPRVEVPVGIPILCEGFSVREWYRATTLSKGGFFAVTTKPLAPGTVLMVTFYGPRSRHINTVAVVRDVVPGKGMGMEFCFLPASYLETLHSWITSPEGGPKERSGTAPSEAVSAQK